MMPPLSGSQEGAEAPRSVTAANKAAIGTARRVNPFISRSPQIGLPRRHKDTKQPKIFVPSCLRAFVAIQERRQSGTVLLLLLRACRRARRLQVLIVPGQVPLEPIALIAWPRDAVVFVRIDDELRVDSQAA